MIRRDADIAALAASAQAGGDWYRASDGGRLIELAVAPFGDWTVYEVQFLEAEDGHANFAFDISQGEELSAGSRSPWTGWVSWDGAQLVISYGNDDLDRFGLDTVDSPVVGSRRLDGTTQEEWALLARTIALTLLR